MTKTSLTFDQKWQHLACTYCILLSHQVSSQVRLFYSSSPSLAILLCVLLIKIEHAFYLSNIPPRCHFSHSQQFPLFISGCRISLRIFLMFFLNVPIKCVFLSRSVSARSGVPNRGIWHPQWVQRGYIRGAI